MTNRRGFMGWLAAILGVGNLPQGFSDECRVKQSILPDKTLLILTLPEGVDYSDEQVDRMWHNVKEQTGCHLIIVPFGTETKVLSPGGVYQRERLENYEYEVIALSEEALRKRLADWGWVPFPQDRPPTNRTPLTGPLEF